jgi:surface antigen
VPVSHSPRVGAIAQWNAGESSSAYLSGSSTPNATFTAGGYGHVGYVAAVYSDGSVLIEQYNMGDSRSYSVMRMKAPRYLLF